MLEKKWLRNHFEFFFKSQFAPLSSNSSNGGTNIITIKGRSFYTNLKWVWKYSKLELFIPITSNKNEQESNKNLKAITGQLEPNSLNRPWEQCPLRKWNLTLQ
jgi:hypothetical protein